MDWLAGTPMAMIRACLAQMRRVRAREAVHDTARIALGTGSAPKADADRIRRDWTEAAEWPRPAAKPFNPFQLGQAGFAVTRVPKVT